MLINLHIKDDMYIIKAFKNNAFQNFKNTFKISFNSLLPNENKFEVYNSNQGRRVGCCTAATAPL